MLNLYSSPFLLAGALAFSILIGWFSVRIVSFSLSRIFRLLSLRNRAPRRSARRPEITLPKVFDSSEFLASADSGHPYILEAIDVLGDLRQRTNAGLPVILAALRGMNAYAFEELVAICLRERGLEGYCPPTYSHDGGVDVLAFWEGRAVVVQAKRWRRHICNRDIVALADLAETVAGIGLFVHTGRTGKRSWRKALMRGVNIISGAELVDLVLGRRVSIRWDVPLLPNTAPDPSLAHMLPFLNESAG